MALSRDQIVGQAVTILDNYGLADLSMRRLAASLQVQPGALYWHFANKQSLLAAVADAMMTDIQVVGDNPAARVRGWAEELRNRLLAHRDGAELVASVLSMRMGAYAPVKVLATLLEDSTLGAAERLRFASTVVHFVIGHTLDEQGHAQMVQLKVIEPDADTAQEDFDYAIGLLLRGLGE